MYIYIGRLEAVEPWRYKDVAAGIWRRCRDDRIHALSTGPARWLRAACVGEENVIQHIRDSPGVTPRIMNTSHEMNGTIGDKKDKPSHHEGEEDSVSSSPKDAPKTMLDYALMVSAIVVIAIICGFYIAESAASRTLRFFSFLFGCFL